jgi:hypothetical protein
MDRIATGAAADRRDLFNEAAAMRGMNPVIIEKDFWVCWILKRLFSDPTLSGQMVFKGGTSLSKVFGLIDRFSEDIDLILDWRLLGYGADAPYSIVQSKTKQTRYNDEMNARAAEYIRATQLAQINGLLAPVAEMQAAIDAEDPHTINISYPAAFVASYIRPAVRLEIGPLASWVPSRSQSILSYAAASFPNAFKDPACVVVAIDAERTFWEKPTILHQETYRTGPPPPRYSRHYYDLHKLARSPVKALAMADQKLLDAVVDFKQRFYYSSWAHYELAKPGSFRLCPSEEQARALEVDYRAMHQMFYQEPPVFAEVIETLRALEGEINSAVHQASAEAIA